MKALQIREGGISYHEETGCSITSRSSNIQVIADYNRTCKRDNQCVKKQEISDEIRSYLNYGTMVLDTTTVDLRANGRP
jgi:hypothetical protein